MLEVRIEDRFNLKMRDLRVHAYSEYNWDGLDDEDFVPNSAMFYVNCYEDGELVGTSRLVRYIFYHLKNIICCLIISQNIMILNLVDWQLKQLIQLKNIVFFQK